MIPAFAGMTHTVASCLISNPDVSQVPAVTLNRPPHYSRDRGLPGEFGFDPFAHRVDEEDLRGAPHVLLEQARFPDRPGA